MKLMLFFICISATSPKYNPASESGIEKSLLALKKRRVSAVPMQKEETEPSEVQLVNLREQYSPQATETASSIEVKKCMTEKAELEKQLNTCETQLDNADADKAAQLGVLVKRLNEVMKEKNAIQRELDEVKRENAEIRAGEENAEELKTLYAKTRRLCRKMSKQLLNETGERTECAENIEETGPKPAPPPPAPEPKKTQLNPQITPQNPSIRTWQTARA